MGSNLQQTIYRGRRFDLVCQMFDHAFDRVTPSHSVVASTFSLSLPELLSRSGISDEEKTPQEGGHSRHLVPRVAISIMSLLPPRLTEPSGGAGGLFSFVVEEPTQPRYQVSES